MKVLLNHKDKIVSFGLLPTIITLCGLYFFPTTLMLGIGFSISVAALLYDIFRLRSLNFFLLQGFAAIGRLEDAVNILSGKAGTIIRQGADFKLYE